MLSMKTLRVAIVTMGSALLLGPSFAAATVQVLDAMGGPDVVTYAAETLATVKDAADADAERDNDITTAPSNVMAQGRTTHYALVSPDHPVQVLVVKPSRRIQDETLFIRLDLEGGMVFNGADVELHKGERTFSGTDDAEDTQFASSVASATTASAGQTEGGTAGDSFVVFRYAAEATGPTQILVNESLWFQVDHALAVPMGTGSYGATISAYRNADDASDGLGGVSSISGGGTIVRGRFGS